MKRFMIVLAFTVAASALALAQGGNVEQSIKALMEQWRQAALKGDAATLDKLLADDHIGINVLRVTSTKADVLERYKSGKLKYEAIDVSEMKVRVYGDTALVNYTGNVKGHFGDTDLSGQYRAVRVWVKRKGSGRVFRFNPLASHSSHEGAYPTWLFYIEQDLNELKQGVGPNRSSKL